MNHSRIADGQALIRSLRSSTTLNHATRHMHQGTMPLHRRDIPALGSRHGPALELPSYQPSREIGPEMYQRTRRQTSHGAQSCGHSQARAVAQAGLDRKLEPWWLSIHESRCQMSSSDHWSSARRPKRLSKAEPATADLVRWKVQPSLCATSK